MKQINKIVSLSAAFTTKLAYEYIKCILKYVLIGIVGFIPVALSFVEPMFALLALIVTIPTFCFSFWKGYVVTYALNYAAFDFLAKKEIKPFKEYIQLANQDEKSLAKFVSFIAIVSTIFYIPTIKCFMVDASMQQIMIDPSSAFSNIKPDVLIISIITTVILAQFINFSLQAFFFGKKENYFNLFINCYKNTGFVGFIISNIIIGLTTYLGCVEPVIYFIIFIPLNLVVYSINLFWYADRVNKAEA